MRDYIPDKNITELLEKIIGSFSSVKGKGVGLPLGNLTSQLFANVYLNKLDQFIKHRLKAKYYIRYADDFVIFSKNREWLEDGISKIDEFLRKELKLELHPAKVFVKTVSSGVDFLGMINFSDHRVLRTKTKRRMLKKLSKKYELLRRGIIPEKSLYRTLESYKGMLGHCNGHTIQKGLECFSFLPAATLWDKMKNND